MNSGIMRRKFSLTSNKRIVELNCDKSLWLQNEQWFRRCDSLLCWFFGIHSTCFECDHEYNVELNKIKMTFGSVRIYFHGSPNHHRNTYCVFVSVPWFCYLASFMLFDLMLFATLYFFTVCSCVFFNWEHNETINNQVLRGLAPSGIFF